jgi:HNH endonuclease
MSAPETVCAYCGKPELSGKESPEHPIAHALGASMTTRAVCDPCNARANVEVDQPFLRDDFVRLSRAFHDVRDPRRPHEPVKDPLKRGFTEDGTFVSVDEDWRPHLHGRIVEDSADPNRVTIQAGSVEEAERLKAKLAKRAAEEGQELVVESIEHGQFRPRIHAKVKLDLKVWWRAAAKMALGLAAEAYPPDWQLSADADALRTVMSSPDPLAPDVPKLGGLHLGARDEPLLAVVEPPQHAAWFVRSDDGRRRVFIVLFGERLITMCVDTMGRPVPEVAWRLDPARPRADGRTTWERLLIEAAPRLGPALAAARQGPPPAAP